MPSGSPSSALVVIYVFSLAYTGVLSLLGDFDATEEQGLVPDEWDSSRAAPFIAFFLAVTLLAPFVEELTYRGLGFSLSPYGVVLAIVATGVLFGLAHGLLIGLPVLTFFGIVVAWLRAKTAASTRGSCSTPRSTASPAVVWGAARLRSRRRPFVAEVLAVSPPRARRWRLDANSSGVTVSRNWRNSSGSRSARFTP